MDNMGVYNVVIPKVTSVFESIFQKAVKGSYN